MRGASVAVVVVAHDGGSGLASCIAALRATVYRDYELVVVDNASSDASIASSGAWASEVLALETNRGFAGGVNAGIAFHDQRFGSADVYALVNQDCVVAPGWLDPLVARLGGDRRVAVVGARLYDADGRTLQHAGATIAANGLTQHIGRGCADPTVYREARDVDYVTGALCAFTAEAWRAFGPLDEEYYPAYFEEVDFCARCRRGGYRIVYEPSCEGLHAEASVLGAGSDAYLRAYHAGRMRFAAAHLLVRGRCLSALAAEAAWLLSLRHLDEIRPALAAYRALPRLLRARQAQKQLAGERR